MLIVRTFVFCCCLPFALPNEEGDLRSAQARLTVHKSKFAVRRQVQWELNEKVCVEIHPHPFCYAQFRRSVRLKCSVNVPSSARVYSLYWKLNGTLITEAVRKNKLLSSDDFRYDPPRVGNGQFQQLLIMELRDLLYGTYSCHANTSLGEASNYTELKKIKTYDTCNTPPLFLDGKPESLYEVAEGKSVEITCAATCGAFVQLAGELRGPQNERILYESKSTTDFITLVSMDDGHVRKMRTPAPLRTYRIQDFNSTKAGRYVCSAANLIGKAERHFTVSLKRETKAVSPSAFIAVTDKPKVPRRGLLKATLSKKHTVVKRGNCYYVPENQMVRYICSARRWIPVPHITMNFKSEHGGPRRNVEQLGWKVKRSSHRSAKKINHLKSEVIFRASAHSGHYSCSAQNSAGSAESTFSLLAGASPSFVNIQQHSPAIRPDGAYHTVLKTVLTSQPLPNWLNLTYTDNSLSSQKTKLIRFKGDRFKMTNAVSLLGIRSTLQLGLTSNLIKTHFGFIKVHLLVRSSGGKLTTVIKVKITNFTNNRNKDDDNSAIGIFRLLCENEFDAAETSCGPLPILHSNAQKLIPIIWPTIILQLLWY